MSCRSCKVQPFFAAYHHQNYPSALGQATHCPTSACRSPGLADRVTCHLPIPYLPTEQWKPPGDMAFMWLDIQNMFRDVSLCRCVRYIVYG